MPTTDLLGPIADAVRARVDATDGALFVVCCDHNGRPMLTTAVREPVRDVDELYARHVAGLVTCVPVPCVVLAVRRADGRPARVDRTLWRAVRARLEGPIPVLAMVVVGRDAHRAMPTAPPRHAA